ncbi:sensor histidine kinase [Hymenobacter sp. YC55]|uniref:sensor histidine kinase n=1 Tax=Hymenobacter sp. YC55 TaxID=3034019 RepID=UPI0023F6828D|nr:sensor histidine kinase [Hymenobacter sp. YC55]MDF7810648.1 histidine kinase [Hymenobacter sp. YC55]
MPAQPAEQLDDRWIRVSGIAFFVIITGYALNVFDHLFTLDSAKILLESLISSAITWEVDRWIIIKFQRHFPALKQVRTRLLFIIPLCWVFNVLQDWVLMWLVNVIGYHKPYNAAAFKQSIQSSVIIAFLITGIQEAVYYFSRLLQAEKETEQLKKENLQTQLDSLKQQVNPHFLFNSLNTLSYLISEDAEKAEEFLDEMCKVYRYLLRNNENELTNLATELQFIRSYFHLLKTRYGDSLHLNLAIEPSDEQRLLPSLTLQLLVENAVKHNVIHKDHPLTVHISTQNNGQLTVKNNLQKKVQKVASNQVGLSNIASKFSLLKQPNIKVQQTETEFLVTIPLIQPSH